jgi:hypothetical protein
MFDMFLAPASAPSKPAAAAGLKANVVALASPRSVTYGVGRSDEGGGAGGAEGLPPNAFLSRSKALMVSYPGLEKPPRYCPHCCGEGTDIRQRNLHRSHGCPVNQQRRPLLAEPPRGVIMIAMPGAGSARANGEGAASSSSVSPAQLSSAGSSPGLAGYASSPAYHTPSPARPHEGAGSRAASSERNSDGYSVSSGPSHRSGAAAAGYPAAGSRSAGGLPASGSFGEGGFHIPGSDRAVSAAHPRPGPASGASSAEGLAESPDDRHAYGLRKDVTPMSPAAAAAGTRPGLRLTSSRSFAGSSAAPPAALSRKVPESLSAGVEGWANQLRGAGYSQQQKKGPPAAPLSMRGLRPQTAPGSTRGPPTARGKPAPTPGRSGSALPSARAAAKYVQVAGPGGRAQAGPPILLSPAYSTAGPEAAAVGGNTGGGAKGGFFFGDDHDLSASDHETGSEARDRDGADSTAAQPTVVVSPSSAAPATREARETPLHDVLLRITGAAAAAVQGVQDKHPEPTPEMKRAAAAASFSTSSVAGVSFASPRDEAAAGASGAGDAGTEASAPTARTDVTASGLCRSGVDLSKLAASSLEGASMTPKPPVPTVVATSSVADGPAPVISPPVVSPAPAPSRAIRFAVPDTPPAAAGAGPKPSATESAGAIDLYATPYRTPGGAGPAVRGGDPSTGGSYPPSGSTSARSDASDGPPGPLASAAAASPWRAAGGTGRRSGSARAQRRRPRASA